MTFHYSPDSTLLRHPYMYYTDKVNWLRINKVNNKYWKLWLWVCVLFLSRISSRATSMKANVKCYVLTIILNGNNIAQGEINIFSHFNIRGYIPFSSFSRINRKWLLKSKKYYRIRVQQVKISRKRRLICLYQTILVLSGILGEKREKSYARFLIKPEGTNRFCWFSISNTGYR